MNIRSIVQMITRIMENLSIEVNSFVFIEIKPKIDINYINTRLIGINLVEIGITNYEFNVITI